MPAFGYPVKKFFAGSKRQKRNFFKIQGSDAKKFLRKVSQEF